MLSVLFVSLFCLDIAEPLVRDTGGQVGSRQFIRDRSWWYDIYNGHQITVTYTISDEFPSWDKDYIREKIDDIKSKTCLKFVEYFPHEVDKCDACIRFIRDPARCRTYINKREIYLAEHCFGDHWVLHEILHALGFGHEHQRPDRDCYVEVTGDGLTDPEYKKQERIDISFPYDVHSIMHYRRGDRLRPAKFAWNQDEEFGQYDQLTEMNVIALNYMYCGGRHYCDIHPERCQYFRCWIECNPCSDEPVSQCRNCTGNTYW